MPIYEFYCVDCHTVFNFFSRRVDTQTCPLCPKCGKQRLSRQVSLFSRTGRARSAEDEAEAPPFDEGRMTRAMQALADNADRIDENDPRQAADLMRRLTDMTGIRMGDGMEEALRRMEKGEDPEEIEARMGDRLEEEDPFILPGGKPGGRTAGRRNAPGKDDTLYDLFPE